jgi:PLP dependent protein
MIRIEENFIEVKQVIQEAATRSGRSPEAIEIMAVTKTLPPAAVSEAVGVGIKIIGENRVQEALGKFDDGERKYRLHLIGHLQQNKAKHIPGFFDCVESIDKIETAAALDRYCLEKGETIDVLFEVNTSGEDTKSGFTSIDELKRAVDAVLEMKSVYPKGLMTIAPFTDQVDLVRSSFAKLRSILEEVRPAAKGSEFSTLSMGMSSDYRIAIEEGSTRVRIGTGLFGSRS